MAEILLTGNPRRRKKSRKSRRTRRASRRRSHRTSRRTRRASRRSYRRVSRRRRNPSFRSITSGFTSGLVPTLKSGAIGAVGGLANDALYGFAKPYLPAFAQTGFGRSAAKILSAILVGMAANMVMRGRGRDFAVGAATVVLHEAAKERLVGMFPALPLGEYDLGYVDPAAPLQETGEMGINGYLETDMGGSGLNGMGAYMNVQGLEDGDDF